jgi:spore germination protein KA
MAPLIPANLGDTIVRLPLWAQKKRPRLFSDNKENRVGDNQKPQPPESRGMVNSVIEKGDQDEQN